MVRRPRATPLDMSRRQRTDLIPYVASTDWDGGSKVASWSVLQCNKNTFCCRPATDTTNCCGNSSAVVSADIGTLLLSTATATVTAGTGTAVPTVTVTAVSSATTDQAGNGTVVGATCPVDRTAVVGGAVGGTLGAALLASLGALAFMMKKRRDYMAYPPPSTAPTQGAQGSSMMHSPGYLEYYSKPAQHPDGSLVPPQELPERSRHEMQ